MRWAILSSVSGRSTVPWPMYGEGNVLGCTKLCELEHRVMEMHERGMRWAIAL